MPSRRRRRRLIYGSGLDRSLEGFDTSTEDSPLDVSLDQTDDTLSSVYDTSFEYSFPDLPLDPDPANRPPGRVSNNQPEHCLYHTIKQKVIEHSCVLKNIALILLTTLPSFLVVWNSLNSIENFLLALVSLSIQSALTLIFSATFISICLLSLSKKTLLEWTKRNINDSLTYNGNDNQRFGQTTCESGTQTDEQGDVADITLIKKNFEMKLKCSRRQYLKLKREYARRIMKLKETTKEHSEFLSRLQLKFPDLEKERDMLIAEKEAIEKQHEEEKRRNRELINRFQRLQQQLGRNGQQHRQILNPY